MLLKYELYKLFSQKILPIVFGICIFVQVFWIFNGADFKGYKAAYKYFKGNEGKITEANIKIAKKYDEEMKAAKVSGKNFEDNKWMFVDKFKYLDSNGKEAFKDADYDRKNYNNKILKIKNELESLKINGSYDYKEKLKEYEMLKKSSYTTGIYYTGGWQWILRSNSQSDFILVGALIVIGLSSIFSDEYSIGSDSLIFCSKFGKSKFTESKIVAAFIYCIFTVFVISAVNFGIYAYLLGLHGYNVQLRNIEYYERTFFNMKIWQFYVLQRVLIIFGSFTLSLLVLLISSLNRSSIVSAFISGMFFMLPDAAERFGIPGIAAFADAMLKGIKTPKVFLYINTIFEFNYAEIIKLEDNNGAFLCNFFGTPMLYENVFIIVLSILCILTCMLIFTTIRKCVAAGTSHLR